MRYQLVLQLPEDIMGYEEFIEIENSMITALQGKANVDGHDMGAGEINFFVLTDDPEEVFKKIMELLNKETKKMLKAAYRETESEKYVILWPKTLREFCVR